MKKILILIFLYALFIPFSFSSQENENFDEVYVPEEITWTQRFILTELKELRVDQEALRREIFIEIQNREI
jgi:hypothetical protein